MWGERMSVTTPVKPLDTPVESVTRPTTASARVGADDSL